MPATPLSLRALGVRIDVLVDELTLSGRERAALRHAWQWCLDDAGAAEITIEASVGEVFVSPHSEGALSLLAAGYDELADRLAGTVTSAALTARRGELVMLHAGAVAHPETGQVAAFIGPSGRGKTTATAALGRRFCYVSDETVAVGADLGVVPYGKPLSIRRSDGGPWKEQRNPSDLGLRPPGGAPLSLAAVVLLDRRQTRQDPEIGRVSFIDALDALVPQVSYLGDRHRPLHDLAELFDACGGLKRVVYSDADDLLPVVEELLGRGVPEPSYRHADVIDVYRTDDRTALMVAGQVVVLDGIGPAIWEAATVPSTLEAIADCVVRRHGAPDEVDPVAMVGESVSALVAAGILVETAAWAGIPQ